MTDPASRIMLGRKGYLQGDNAQTVEPVFGQMKENQGADRLMMRGDEEAKGEWSLHCSAHNLRTLQAESVRRGKEGQKWPRT